MVSYLVKQFHGFLKQYQHWKLVKIQIYIGVTRVNHEKLIHSQYRNSPPVPLPNFEGLGYINMEFFLEYWT